MPAASPGPTGVSPENSAIGAAPTASRTCPSPASDYEIMTARPRVTIVYCRQCNWLLRAGWLAQELLTTFAEEIGAGRGLLAVLQPIGVAAGDGDQGHQGEQANAHRAIKPERGAVVH